MTWAGWTKKWLPIAAVGVTLLGLLDPLEGFAIVLMGGVLSLMAAIQERSRFTTLVTWGVGLAAVGCIALVWLSSIGGVGASTGRSPWWLVVVAPYPIGVLLFLIGTVVMLRTRWEAKA